MNRKFINNNYIMYSLAPMQCADDVELKCISQKLCISNSECIKNNEQIEFSKIAVGALLYLIHIYTDDDNINIKLVYDNNNLCNLFTMYFSNYTIGEYISILNRRCIKENFVDTNAVTEKITDKIVEIHCGNELKNLKSKVIAELSFVFIQNFGEITLDIYYSKTYKDKQVSDIGKYLINIYRGLHTLEQSELLSNINYLEEEDKKKMIHHLNNTDYVSESFDYPIHTLIEQQVMKTPEAIAMVYNEQYITYRNMNERANQIARYINDNNLAIGNNGIIAIMFERSIEMVITILAILKAGHAYVPLDPEYPVERVKMILSDCNTNVIIKGEGIKKIQDYYFRVYEYDDIFHFASKYKKNNLNLQVKINDLCYVLFTSGSTGKPKGVMIEHKQSVNTLIWYGEMCKLDTNVNCMLSYNYTSDPSAEDIFSTLIFGARLYIPPKELFMDKRSFSDFIIKNEINVFNFVPRVIQTMLCGTPKFESLEYVLSGGDVLTDHVKDELVGIGYIVINDYGPTEASVDCLSLKCDENKVTLGYPIKNMKVYVLDQKQQLKPMGAIGELYVSGVGVARGYINQEELTKQVFFDDPFNKGNRMYKTGDVAMWNMNGQIEFFGRKDTQVKINGYRIELHEIEQALLQCEGIEEAVVAAYEDEVRYLCAYYITNKTDLNIEKIKECLKFKLPAYMMPRYYVRIDNIPLTIIGKTNYKKLKKPDIDEIIDIQEDWGFENYQYGEAIKNVVLDICKKFKIPYNINFELTPSENGFDSFSIMELLAILSQQYNFDIDYEKIVYYKQRNFDKFLSNLDELIKCEKGC